MKPVEIFGIDLGTTNSCISYVDGLGRATVIPNREGNLTTPSVVQFEDANRIVGEEARRYALLYPDQVVMNVKHKIGKPGAPYSYQGNIYTPEEISSYILRKLADDAALFLNHPIKDVVITCPAYFGVAQREATANAGALAGLTVHEVLNEPTAAAILYGLSQAEDQVALVYDLGGGTFDVTVIAVQMQRLKSLRPVEIIIWAAMISIWPWLDIWMISGWHRPDQPIVLSRLLKVQSSSTI